MSYADYAFYTGEYGGTVIPEEQFDLCARRAGETLDADTLNRAAGAVGGPWDDAVRRCCCALAELEYAARTGRGAAVQKETLGSWSRAYLCGAQDTPRAQARRAEEQYLAGSGLLYRGRSDHV